VCLPALPPNQLQELKTNKEKARSFVLYHATQGRINSDQISDNQVRTLSETKAQASSFRGQVKYEVCWDMYCFEFPCCGPQDDKLFANDSNKSKIAFKRKLILAFLQSPV